MIYKKPDKVVQVAFTKEEYAVIKEAAYTEQRPVSRIVKFWLLQKIKEIQCKK